MITTNSTTHIHPDLEQFVIGIFSGITAASEMSCNYTLTLTDNDVAIIAEEYKKINNIEIN